MAKTKFTKGLKVDAGTKIDLTFVVCLEGNRQTGAAFTEFVGLVDKHQVAIRAVNIVLADYLKRWYVGAEGGEQQGRLWLENNQAQLVRLESLVSVNISGWKEKVNDNSEFRSRLALVKSDYESSKPKTAGDEGGTFYRIVNQLATEHQGKKNFDAAREYLLEECAGASLVGTNLAFPAPLNRAILHFVTAHSFDIRYQAYELDPTCLQVRERADSLMVPQSARATSPQARRGSTSAPGRLESRGAPPLLSAMVQAPSFWTPLSVDPAATGLLACVEAIKAAVDGNLRGLPVEQRLLIMAHLIRSTTMETPPAVAPVTVVDSASAPPSTDGDQTYAATLRAAQ